MLIFVRSLLIWLFANYNVFVLNFIYIFVSILRWYKSHKENFTYLCNSFVSRVLHNWIWKGAYLVSKRALIRLQKSTFCKPKGRLFEAKRASTNKLWLEKCLHKNFWLESNLLFHSNMFVKSLLLSCLINLIHLIIIHIQNSNSNGVIRPQYSYSSCSIVL